MTTNQAIILARKHASCSSSRACLADAISIIDSERFSFPERMQYAKDWAVRSLAYSVGVFHPDYQQAAAFGGFPNSRHDKGAWIKGTDEDDEDYEYIPSASELS